MSRSFPRSLTDIVVPVGDQTHVQTVFEALTERLERMETEARELFLMKAYLLLAEAHGELETVLAVLDDADASSDGDVV